MPRSSLSLPVLLLRGSFAFAKVVTYNFNIGWISAAPDGFTRPIIAINGQFPLPTINVTVGDHVVINAVNNLGETSATLHFHGIYQNGSAAQDGPAHITQCGIPSGSNLTYSFTVNQPGTYFYHSHFEGQYPDGLRGAFIVDDPASPYKGQYDFESLITLSDWYRDQMSDMTNYFLNNTLNTDGSEPLPYSALINDAQNVKLHILPGKTYFLRIINFSAFSQMYLHFDQHKMTIIEIDGIYTHPQEVSVLYLAVAQRYGVLLETKTCTNKNYAVQGRLDETMFDGFGDPKTYPTVIVPTVAAYLIYDDQNPLPPPMNCSLSSLAADIIDDLSLVPYDNEPLLKNPAKTFVLDLEFFIKDGQNRAGFNGITWLQQKVPSLFTAMTTGQAATNNLTYGINANAMVLELNEVIEVVVNNKDTGSHPVHIHGHAPQIVARVSNSTYVPASSKKKRQLVNKNLNAAMPDAASMGYDGDESKMPKIPMRRDTWMVAPAGYTVFRFVANNPGVWFFHCHMDWHNIAGLAATFIEAPLELQKTQSIPAAWTYGCQSQGIATRGNAAANTKNYTDLTGAMTVCPPLGIYSGAAPI